MRSRLLALLLVLAIWPALGETVELVVHLAEHGDLAHDPADEHAGVPLGSDEHGCSALYHLCSSGQGCATPTTHAIVAVTSPMSTRLPPIAPPLDRSGCNAPMPPIRPPIA